MSKDRFNPRRVIAPRGNCTRTCRPPLDLAGGASCALVLLFAFLAPACEGRPLSAAQQEAASVHDGSVGQDLASFSDGAQKRRDGGGPALHDAGAPVCVIAIRVDDCCTAPYPSLSVYVNKDPCLVPYPPKTIPAACKAKWPKKCDIVDCTWGSPLTRLVQAVPGGGCTYRTECSTSKDCTMAVDARDCCTCPASYPQEMLGTDPCIITPALAVKPNPAPACPDRCKTEIICDGCPPPGKEPQPICTQLVGVPEYPLPDLSVCTTSLTSY